MSKRGNFYGNISRTREDGKRFGRDVGRQSKTFALCRAAVDAGRQDGETAYIQLWSDVTQSRRIVAECGTDGVWYAIDPFTGDRNPVA